MPEDIKYPNCDNSISTAERQSLPNFGYDPKIFGICLGCYDGVSLDLTPEEIEEFQQQKLANLNHHK